RGGLVAGSPHRHVARLPRGVDARAGDIGVDAVLDALGHRVGGVQRGRQGGGEGGNAVGGDVGHAAVERHALQGELAQVDVTAAVAAGGVVVGVLALARSAWLVLDGDVVVAHVVQPGHAVAAAVEAGDARGVADGQVHGAPGQVQ